MSKLASRGEAHAANTEKRGEGMSTIGCTLGTRGVGAGEMERRRRRQEEKERGQGQ